MTAAWVDRQARKGTGPSDHAPVIVDLDTAPDGDIGPMVPYTVRPAGGPAHVDPAAAEPGLGLITRSAGRRRLRRRRTRRRGGNASTIVGTRRTIGGTHTSITGRAEWAGATYIEGMVFLGSASSNCCSSASGSSASSTC